MDTTQKLVAGALGIACAVLASSLVPATARGSSSTPAGGHQQPPARYQVITHVVTMNGPQALPRFDPALGALQRVDYDFMAMPRLAGILENRSCCDQDINMAGFYRSGWQIRGTPSSTFVEPMHFDHRSSTPVGTDVHAPGDGDDCVGPDTATYDIEWGLIHWQGSISSSSPAWARFSGPTGTYVPSTVWAGWSNLQPGGSCGLACGTIFPCAYTINEEAWVLVVTYVFV